MFRVAERLGMTLGELSRRMSYAELLEWQAWLEEVHTDDSWHQNAAIRWDIRRLMGDKTTKYEDLLPDRRKPLEKVQEDPLAAFRAWAAGHNANVEAGGGTPTHKFR